MDSSQFVKLVSEQNFSASIKLLDAAIKAAQDAGDKQGLASLHLNRGQCNQKLQLYRKALKDFDEALAVKPNCTEALYRKGIVLVALKKLEDAKSAWATALASATATTDVQLLLDLNTALRDPSKVFQEPASLSSHHGVIGRISRISKPIKAAGSALLWSAVPILLLALAYMLTAHSFEVASNLTLQQLLQQNGISEPLVPPAPSAPGPSPSSAHQATPSSSSSSTPRAPAPVSAPKTPSASSSPASPGGAAGAAGGQEPSRAGRAPSPPASRPQAAALSTSSSSARAQPPAASAPPAPAATAATRSAADAGTGSSGGAGDAGVVDIDCAATQAECASSRGKQGSPAGLQNMLNNSVAIQLAVTQINSGAVKEAEELLDRVLETTPKELGALVARGTARALRRDLKGAIDDFSRAIVVEPRYADSYKRRGQARSALGELAGALEDLKKAVDLMPLWGVDTGPSRAECYVERGMIYQKQRDYRKACRELKEAVKLDPHNVQAWNVLGLCSTSQGDIRDGVRAYEKAIELNPKLKEAWINMAQALKEEGRTKEAERAFLKALALDEPGAPSVHALRIMGQMRQQKGEHWSAIKILDKAVGYNREEQMIDLLYLRAICYHALGYVREAVRDYEDCLGYTRGNATEEQRAFQFLSFYQKEMVLYMYKNLDRPVVDFCPDAELQPLFKELWCKKGPPTAGMIAQYTPQPLPPSSPPLPPPRPDAEKLKMLTELADRLGMLLQNNHQGFLPNARQQRAAGYAALELAQAVKGLVAARRAGNALWVNSEGSSVQAGAAGRHQFGWRDAMDIVVKWRQMAEPNDQVVWVDLLTRREFEQGFGSHTPMFSGQTKCVRYYMNFKRALGLQKEVLLREGHAFDAQNRAIPLGSPHQQDAIRAAQTAEDMYLIIQQDSWVVVPIASYHRSNHSMEGTRLTLVKVPNQPDAYEFSIRTPVTPPRWKDFDAELEAAWESIVRAFLDGEPQKIAQSVLVYAYYWYNFMPLARGTAACGYTTILSLFWAAGMPVTASIPKDYQVDWEAILSQHPDQFIGNVSKFLYPPQAHSSSEPDAAQAGFPDVNHVPAVTDVLGTMRHRIEALNGEGMKRL